MKGVSLEIYQSNQYYREPCTEAVGAERYLSNVNKNQKS